MNGHPAFACVPNLSLIQVQGHFFIYFIFDFLFWKKKLICVSPQNIFANYARNKRDRLFVWITSSMKNSCLCWPCVIFSAKYLVMWLTHTCMAELIWFQVPCNLSIFIQLDKKRGFFAKLSADCFLSFIILVEHLFHFFEVLFRSIFVCTTIAQSVKICIGDQSVLYVFFGSTVGQPDPVATLAAVTVLIVIYWAHSPIFTFFHLIWSVASSGLLVCHLHIVNKLSGSHSFHFQLTRVCVLIECFFAICCSLFYLVSIYFDSVFDFFFY